MKGKSDWKKKEQGMKEGGKKVTGWRGIKYKEGVEEKKRMRVRY